MPETSREKQVRKAQEKAVQTGNRKDLAVYLKMRRENYEEQIQQRRCVQSRA